MAYDDEIWEAVPREPGAPPEHLVRFVRALPAAEDVLDLGCGDGRLTAHLQARRLTGADASRVALGRARATLPQAQLVQVEPDGRLPFDDTSFDLVLCAETVEHARDVQGLLSEARRILRPGAMLAITTPAHGRLDAARALVLGWEHQFDPVSPHLRFFTRRSLRRLVTDLGFDVRSLARRRGTLLLTAAR